MWAIVLSLGDGRDTRSIPRATWDSVAHGSFPSPKASRMGLRVGPVVGPVIGGVLGGILEYSLSSFGLPDETIFSRSTSVRPLLAILLITPEPPRVAQKISPNLPSRVGWSTILATSVNRGRRGRPGGRSAKRRQSHRRGRNRYPHQRRPRRGGPRTGQRSPTRSSAGSAYRGNLRRSKRGSWITRSKEDRTRDRRLFLSDEGPMMLEIVKGARAKRGGRPALGP